MFSQNLNGRINKTANLLFICDIAEIDFLDFFCCGDFKNISLDIAMKKRSIFLPRHFQNFFFENINIGNGVHEKQLFQNSTFNSWKYFVLVKTISEKRPEVVSALTCKCRALYAKQFLKHNHNQKYLKQIAGRL
jgi:hypothetical protein